MQTDALYPLLGAAIVAVIGFTILMKGGSKFGWIIVAAGCVWAWYTLQPIITRTKQSSAGQQGSSYYDTKR